METTFLACKAIPEVMIGAVKSGKIYLYTPGCMISGNRLSYRSHSLQAVRKLL